jgi:phosphonate transport system substrate-binding protein
MDHTVFVAWRSPMGIFAGRYRPFIQQPTGASTRSMEKILHLLILGLILFAGCDGHPPTSADEAPESALKIGLTPEQNIFQQLERYEPIADYISQRVGARIELKILTRYGNVIDNFASLELDAAYLGSFTYTLAHEKIGVEVIARPETISGESTYHGLIFVRKDSKIKTIADMKGKVLAFVDQATMAGFIFPLAYLKRNGIEDYRTYFREAYFTGTHENAIHDVLNGKADVGAAKNTIYRMLLDKDSRIGDELMILARSGDAPENGLAVRKDLDESIKEKLKSTLLAMQDDPMGATILEQFGARRYIPTSTNDYRNVMLLIQEIGLDLKTYDYMSD